MATVIVMVMMAIETTQHELVVMVMELMMVIEDVFLYSKAVMVMATVMVVEHALVMMVIGVMMVMMAPKVMVMAS